MSVFQIRRVDVSREETPTAVCHFIITPLLRNFLDQSHLLKIAKSSPHRRISNIVPFAFQVEVEWFWPECNVVICQKLQNHVLARAHMTAAEQVDRRVIRCLLKVSSDVLLNSTYTPTFIVGGCHIYANDCFRVHWTSENERGGADTPTRKWSYQTTMLTKGRQGENSSPTADCIGHQMRDDFVLTSPESAGEWISARHTIDLEESA